MIKIAISITPLDKELEGFSHRATAVVESPFEGQFISHGHSHTDAFMELSQLLVSKIEGYG